MYVMYQSSKSQEKREQIRIDAGKVCFVGRKGREWYYQRFEIWNIAVICGLKGLDGNEDTDCQIRDSLSLNVG